MIPLWKSPIKLPVELPVELPVGIQGSLLEQQRRVVPRVALQQSFAAAQRVVPRVAPWVA